MKSLPLFLFCFLVLLLAVPRADALTETRTVEYFISKQDAQLTANAWWNETFNWNLSDTGAKIVSAYFDIYGSYGAAGTIDATLNIYLNNTLMSATVMEAQTEAYLAHIIVNATSLFYTDDPATLSNYQFALKNGAANVLGGASARLVVTYEYSSPPKTKTIKRYIDTNTASMAINTWNNETFAFKLNGTNPVVKSAFFEITEMHPTAADNTPAIYLNNSQTSAPVLDGTAPSYGWYGFSNATATTTTPSGGIYGITDTTERFYQFAFKCGAGDTCEGLGAILTVTYESDAEAPIETSSFYVNSTAAQIAIGGWFNTTYWLNLTDPSPKVTSAFIVVRGMLPTVTKATDVSVYLNNTLLGTADYSATVELANFLIILNASSGSNDLFYTPDGSGPTNMQVSIKCAVGACESVSTEVFLTYEYAIAADSTPPQFSLNNSNATSVAPGGAVLLFANWSDATDLQWAMLETNETGTAANKTASPTAPIQINLTGTNSWSNFSWINASISGGTEVGWRIFGNDSAGNANVTGLATFRIFQQITQPIEQSLTVNFQNKNIQTLFQVIRNTITATLQVDKASTFMRSVSSSITTNSGFVSFTTFMRSVSNAVTQNLGVKTVSSILRTINQIITSSIAVTSVTSIFRSISNAITTNTVVGPLNSLFRIISQAVTTNSVLTTSKGFLTTVSQAITQNAVVKTATTFARILSQELTPNSISTRVGSILRPLSQAITQNTAAQAVSSFFKSISQAITNNLATKTITSIFRSISQTLTANTANQILNSIFRSISQAVTQNSATLTANSIFRSVNEAVTNNAIVKTTSSILRTISQAVTANTLTKTAGSFFKIISQTITSNAVAQSFRSILVSISQAITQNLSVSNLGNYFKIISQSISPQAQGGGFRIARYFFISVSQSISHHFNAVLGFARIPPHPTASEVAVFGGGPGLGQTRIIPAVPIKPPPTAAMQFLKQPVLREVVKGQPVVEGIIVKNIGEKTFSLEAEVSGIPEKWVTILPSEAELEPGEKKGFTLFITPPKDAETGDYSVVVSLNGNGISDKTVFILRVKAPPSAQEKVSFERAVSIDKEKESSEIVLNIKNGPEVQRDVSVIENIKKEVANTTDDVIFSEPPDEIIQKDPIVRWKIKELKPYEAKNFTYSVKSVLLEFSPYVYWPAEQVSRKNVSGLTVAPLVPIELSAGKANPAPLIITNNLSASRNVSATMILPEGWILSPQELNYTLEPSETRIFKFNILLPQNAYPGYYTGKVLIRTDEGEIIKDYEFAVLSNFELLIRPIVIVVSAFFVLGILWIRLKVIELRGELEEIKRLTEVRRTEEEIETETAKTKKAMRDLDALYRDNVIGEDSYRMEKSMLKGKAAKLENEAGKLRKATKEEKQTSAHARRFKKEMEQASKNLNELEEDYNKNKISRKFYSKEKKNAESRLARLQKELAGNRPLFEEIKRLAQNRKLLIRGVQKLKLAYDEGFVDKSVYKSSYSQLEEKIKKIDSVLRRKYGMLEREKEKMMGSSVLLKVASQLNV